MTDSAIAHEDAHLSEPHVALGQVVRTVEQLADMAEILYNLHMLVC